MAGSDQIAAISIGTQRITAALFSPKKNSLSLVRYLSSSILVDPAAESTRVAQIAQTTIDIIKALKIGSSQVSYSLPGHSVFTRFIKLPPIDDSDIEQLIQFEAQQQIPFPLDEVTWSYHMLPDTGLEKEALLVAVKKDIINEINDSVKSTGAKVKEVDCAPIALYNAFRSSYPEMSESTLLLDIGAKTSDLIYCENGRFFMRSVPMGGSTVTTAIAREYNISYEEAEQLKISRGLVALSGGHTSGMDEETARLATCIRNAMTRLVSEIPRTTVRYRSEYGGSAPTNIFISGGGAALPYTREFIQERTQTPVQFFNPLHSLTVGAGVDADALSKEAYLLGEVIGTGINAAGKAVIDFELVPDSMAKQRETKKKLPFVIAGMAALIVGAGIFAYAADVGAKAAKVAYDKQSDAFGALQGLTTAIKNINNEAATIDATMAEYSKISDLRYGFVDIIQELKTKAASDSYWIVEFEPIIAYDKASVESLNSGTPAVRKSYKTDKDLSLNDTPSPNEVANSSGKKDSVRAINAIRVKGLVRMDKGGFDQVNWIRRQLEQEPEKSNFDFNLNDKPMEAVKIMKFEDTTANKNAIIKPFTMVLPLKKPIEVAQKATDNK